jgi:hypothetical protein
MRKLYVNGLLRCSFCVDAAGKLVRPTDALGALLRASAGDMRRLERGECPRDADVVRRLTALCGPYGDVLVGARLRVLGWRAVDMAEYTRLVGAGQWI